MFNKMNLLSAVLCTILVSVSTTTMAALQEVPVERQIKINKNTAVTLLPGKVQIVLADDAMKSTLFAADELSMLLGKVLNQPVAIKIGKADPGCTPIYLGLGKVNPELDGKKLTRDAFFIVIEKDVVRIAGKDDPVDSKKLLTGGIWSSYHQRATLFGVYEFLERFAGCRFYFPGEMGTVTPAVSKLDLPETFIIDRPDWQGRKLNGVFSKCMYFEGENPRRVVHPGKTLNHYRRRFSTQHPLPSMHGTSLLNLTKRFAQSNPEYFTLRQNGSRSVARRSYGDSICFSSGIRNEIYEDFKAAFNGDISQRKGLENSLLWNSYRKEWIGRRVVDLMPGDSYERCFCQLCQKSYTKDTNFVTELIWGYVAEVGNKLKKEGYNDVTVTMSAYYPYQAVPQVDLPDNVDVLVCVTGPWDMNNPVKLNRENQLIRDWKKKIGHNVMLSNYGYSNNHSLKLSGIPDPTPRAYGKYYQSLKDSINGVCGFYDDTDRFLYSHLEDYVFSKVAWDNNVNVDKLLQEYYKLMFGAAAATMQKIMDRYEDIWLSRIGGRTVETPIGPVASTPSNTEIWTQIYNEKMIKIITDDFNAAEKAVSSIELKRVKLFRREFLDPLTVARTEWLKTAALPLALTGYLSDRDDCAMYLAQIAGKNTPLTTKVRCQLLNDELVINFDCAEPAPEKMRAIRRKKGDKECWRDNGIEIILNPSGDRKNVCHIFLNHYGDLNAVYGKYDGKRGVYDWSQQMPATGKVTILKDRYLAEVRIPVSALKNFNRDNFPVNFCRSRQVEGAAEALYSWSPVVRNFPDVENFGTIKARQPLLPNGSFTMPLDHKKDWRNSKNFERDTKCYFSAPAALKLSSANAKSYMQYQDIKDCFKPDTRYRLSFVMKTENVKAHGRTGGATVKLQDRPGHQIWLPKKFVTGSTDWTRYSIEFNSASELGVRVQLGLWLYNASGTVWFDDVQLEELGPVK